MRRLGSQEENRLRNIPPHHRLLGCLGVNQPATTTRDRNEVSPVGPILKSWLMDRLPVLKLGLIVPGLFHSKPDIPSTSPLHDLLPSNKQSKRDSQRLLGAKFHPSSHRSNR